MNFKDQIVRLTIRCAGCTKTKNVALADVSLPTLDTSASIEPEMPEGWTEIQSHIVGLRDDCLWVCNDCEEKIATASPFGD